MASGLSLVTTDPGARELVNDNGFAVEKRNHEQLRDAIRRYAMDRDLLERHRVESRRMAERMTWSEAAQAYLQIYGQISG
jgi:glycosyltransferase involved in cell wall biosynthesis